MGSTVTCEKAVSAMKAADGHVYYTLHEQTYEKNVTPHHPHWGCFYFGRLEGAIERIFRAASSCEGGMLQTRKGWTTPEAYIAAWMKALATPRVLYLTYAELRAEASYMASVAPDNVDPTAVALAAAGLTDAASNLKAGQTIRINIESYAGLLADLVSKQLISVWRTFDFTPHLHTSADVAFAYTPALAQRVVIETPVALKLTDEDRLMRDSSGAWRPAGWSYAIVADYVAKIWRSELTSPGGYRRQIKAYREAIKSAPPLPAGVSARVTAKPDDQPWVADQRKRFADNHAVVLLPDGFTVAVTEQNISDLCYLDRKGTEFFLPAAIASTAAPPDLFSRA